MTDGGRLRLDVALDTLSSGYRRRLLLDLLVRDRVDVGERVGVLANGSGVDYGHLRRTLRHVHLPKLEAAGYIAWDRESESVERGSAFDELVPLLELLGDHSGDLLDGWP